MALRLIEMVVKNEDSFDVEGVLQDYPLIDFWKYNSKDDKEIVKILVDAERTGKVLETLSNEFSNSEDFRIVLLPADATLPESEIQREKESKRKRFNFFSKTEHLSIEELFNDISDKSELNIDYISLVVLSTLVAAVGILQGSNVMIIGAMVIAPLLGPNMAMSLGTTLGDFSFIKKSFVTSLAYIFSVIVVSFIIGLILKPDSAAGVLSQYSTASLGDVILSLAAGAAGALSFTIGLSTMLVGVTVSLAVLPSLVTLGIMLGASYYGGAYGALLLFLTNIICINLAGVLTFLIQGIHPVKWWQEEKAKKATIGAVILWAILLGALLLLIFSQKIG